MSLSVSDIIQVMEKFKELGLTSFEIESEGIKMGNQPVPQVVTSPPVQKPVEDSESLRPEDIVTPMSALDEMDEEMIQYWATPYYDELLAKREAMRTAKETEMPNPKRESV